MLLDIYKRKAPVLRLLLGVWLAAFLIGEITARGSGLLPQEQKSTGVLELFFGQRIQDVIAAFDYAVIMLLLSAFLLTIRCPPLLTLPWPPLLILPRPPSLIPLVSAFVLTISRPENCAFLVLPAKVGDRLCLSAVWDPSKCPLRVPSGCPLGAL